MISTDRDRALADWATRLPWWLQVVLGPLFVPLILLVGLSRADPRRMTVGAVMVIALSIVSAGSGIVASSA